MLTKTDIRERTEEYWEHHRGDYRCYIKDLLGRELVKAGEDPKRLCPLKDELHTLALTVGDSFEPLLQAICVLKPSRVILVLNHDYGELSGEDQVKRLCRLILELVSLDDFPEQYRPKKLAPDDIGCITIQEDTPTEVFRALTRGFEAPKARPPADHVNAVDITGAKKNMVVGSFLYAAHTGLPITYVDSDETNPHFRRPYGYLCRIGRIADPYAAFRLRDWERVRQLYKSYNFRGARELLGECAREEQPGSGILRAMSEPLEGIKIGHPLYEEKDIDGVRMLARIMELYEAWDTGDLNCAAKLANEVPERAVPSIVKAFNGHWFEFEAAVVCNPPQGFYRDGPGLRLYAFDELLRIRRLIDCNEDNRSAFLRAAGLNEVLLTARHVRAIPNPAEQQAEVDRLDKDSAKTPNASLVFERLVHAMALSAWWSQTKWFAASDGWKQFVWIRNKLAHTFVSVPKDLAEDGFAFVRANFADFVGASPAAAFSDLVSAVHEAPESYLLAEPGAGPLQAQALSWENVCGACGLNFLPPKLRI
jgi:hypothetical protein